MKLAPPLRLIYLAAGLLLGCSEAQPTGAPTPDTPTTRGSQNEGPAQANWDTVEALRAGRDAHYSPADGGGRAWLERDDGQAPFAISATPDRFTLVYEVGPHGIARGGQVFFQVSPFWDWTTPQTAAPDGRGYTTVTPNDPSIEIRSETLGQQLLGIEITGRPLVAGDRLTIVYGAGVAGALPDRYAERGSAFWFAVDGDGDGTRKFLEDSPRIDVHAGPPAGLLMFAPTVVRPGEAFDVTISWIDAYRNPAAAKANVTLDPTPGIDLDPQVTFPDSSQGQRRVRATARAPGTYRLRASGAGYTTESNPVLVTTDGPRVLWGDLHGHSNYSDGTGVPEDYFRYARDVSGLDIAALTDHDHWGILPLVDQPERWQDIRTQASRFNEPGRFVSLLGFEWTSWIHGHRHVLYFDDDGPLIDSLSPETEHPTQLWSALEGHRALTFAHHSAGGPIATNWDVPPDPRFEPVTEIVSIHGSSEAADSPGAIYDAVSDHYVRDALDRGYVLGFVGSGDRHDGHPGAYQVEPPQGGLAAILAEERTRDSVLAAIRERRVYATNGPRILLRFALDTHGMGTRISVGPSGTLDASAFVQVIAEAPLDRIELVRSGQLVDGIQIENDRSVALQRDIERLVPGEYVYVRAIQANGGAAWSSPIFIAP